MIEGGSRVLSSFLRSPPRSDGSPVVDSVIITVAPMFIGDGVGVVPKVSYLSILYRKDLIDLGGRSCLTGSRDCSYRDDGQRRSDGMYRQTSDTDE
jgi:riboflavin biosynthesis pyrimidine reductase